MIDQLCIVLLVALANYRVWRIMSTDTITEPFHGRLAASEHPVAQWVHSLISCPWCAPWWTGLAGCVALAVWWGWDPPTTILTWLASTTITGFLHQLEDE